MYPKCNLSIVDRFCYFCFEMKKLFALFFALYFLLGSFLPKLDFSQLLYVVDAVEHFECHQTVLSAEGIEHTLWDFFKMHFINPDGHQHDEHHGHDDLPLQHFSQGLQFLAPVLANQNSVPSRLQIATDIVYRPTYYLCDYFSRIEHPPTKGTSLIS